MSTLLQMNDSLKCTDGLMGKCFKNKISVIVKSWNKKHMHITYRIIFERRILYNFVFYALRFPIIISNSGIPASSTLSSLQ